MIEYVKNNDIKQLILNNKSVHYKSILFSVWLYMDNNRLYIKIIWNDKTEIIKEVIYIKDLYNIIKMMLTK